MTGRAGRCLLASLLCVGLLAVVATGGAAAAGPSDHCETVDENTSVIVGGVGDTTYTAEDNVTLYPDSTLTVGYCSDGESENSDWLVDGEGFDTEGDRVNHTYTVTVTGETAKVDFGEHLADENQSVPEDRLIITVDGGGTESAADAGGLNVDDEAAEETYQEYLRAVNETANATAALNETTSALEDGEDDLDAAREAVHRLNETHTNMTDTRRSLLDHLRSAGESGTATGTVAAARTVTEEYRQRDEEVTTAATAYTGAVDAEAEDPRSTVTLSLFGSLGAGVALGLVAGAAVPLIAARRVKEKMKLSRDVSYDRKAALLPILLGLVAVVAGAAILAVIIELGPLLRVIA